MKKVLIVLVLAFVVSGCDKKVKYTVVSADKEKGIEYKDKEGKVSFVLPLGIDFESENQLDKLAEVIPAGTSLEFEKQIAAKSFGLKKNNLYVFIPGDLVGGKEEKILLNSWILKNGLARLNFGAYVGEESFDPSRLKYYKDLKKSEKEAKDNELGIWKTAEQPENK